MPKPDISDSEWMVMEILWREGPCTASRVTDALAKVTGWAPNTVRTLLTRLVDKGAARTRENASGVKEFLPAVKRESCVREESASFMKRVFRGAAKPLLAHFVTNARLSPEEVAELKSLLDQSLKNKP